MKTRKNHKKTKNKKKVKQKSSFYIIQIIQRNHLMYILIKIQMIQLVLNIKLSMI